MRPAVAPPAAPPVAGSRPAASEHPEAGLGVAYALVGYGLWGVLPAYWKALGSVPSVELLGHRVVWSCVVSALLLTLTRRWRELAGVVRSLSGIGPLLLTAAVLGSNWLVYLHAVNTDRVVAASLGYYLNPLLSVALGAVFLRERLRRVQGVAVLLAAAGVAWLTWRHGSLPWISVYLAASFGLYGLVRKVAPAAPLVGFSLETFTLGPFALVYLGLLAGTGAASFTPAQPGIAALLVGAGAVSAAPLLFFAGAAKRLTLATLGLFQYVAPSLFLVLALGFYDEPFTRDHAVTFGCIWAALALYSWDTLRAAR